jgi:hypothetical protein
VSMGLKLMVTFLGELILIIVSGIVPMALQGRNILPEPSLGGASNELEASA